MQEKAQQEVGSGRSHSVKGRNECLLINDGAFIGTPAPSAGREPTLHPGPRNAAPLGGHLLTVPACRWDALGGHHVVLPIFACSLLEVCPRVPVPVSQQLDEQNVCLLSQTVGFTFSYLTDEAIG